jgi:hypothetical protein
MIGGEDEKEYPRYNLGLVLLGAWSLAKYFKSLVISPHQISTKFRPLCSTGKAKSLISYII